MISGLEDLVNCKLNFIRHCTGSNIRRSRLCGIARGFRSTHKSDPQPERGTSISLQFSRGTS